LSSEENKRGPQPGNDAAPEGEAAEEVRASEGEANIPQPEAEHEEAPEVLDEDDIVVDADGFAGLAEELEATRLERDQYLDSLRRLKAEFENSRKRQERERARILSMASERLVQELLPVLDNLDRALEAGGDIREGVQATREQLAEVLAEEGLLPVASDGQPFDPNVHDAVMGQPSEEHEDGTIIQTFQRGYLLNGKPIRPAKVVVAKQV
jgi:molecular chaperone GrpE